MQGRSGATRSGSASVAVSAGADSHETDVVVIGSGVGGLSAAAMLSRHGDSVTVLESHYLPGGVAHAFDIEGYRFVGQTFPRWACRWASGKHVYKCWLRLVVAVGCYRWCIVVRGVLCYVSIVIPTGFRARITYHALQRAHPDYRLRYKDDLF